MRSKPIAVYLLGKDQLFHCFSVGIKFKVLCGANAEFTGEWNESGETTCYTLSVRRFCNYTTLQLYNNSFYIEHSSIKYEVIIINVKEICNILVRNRKHIVVTGNICFYFTIYNSSYLFFGYFHVKPHLKI